MSSVTIKTNFTDNIGGDLGSTLITRDYLISVYPGIAQEIGISPELWIWGYQAFGGLGNNISSFSGCSTPITTFSGGANWKQISSGNTFTAAIKTDGTLWTWGSGNSGQLGHASTSNALTPVTTFTGGTDWKQVSCSNTSTGAIKTDGTLWTWGSGSQGQLGNLAVPGVIISTPITTFAGGNNWKQLSMSSSPAAIKTDGTLWTWGGTNSTGELGNPSAVLNVSTPVTTFAGGNNWADTPTINPEDLYTLSAGSSHVAAIKTDGTLWVWGSNLSGQLGTRDPFGKTTPVTTFAGGTTWKQISSGSEFTAAIKTDGTLWTTGLNTRFQLGVFIPLNRSTPVTTFAGGNNWADTPTTNPEDLYTLSAGCAFSAAIKTDGTLWTWGNNVRSCLGIFSDLTGRSTPVTTFAGGTNWKQVTSNKATGNFSSATFGIKTDGTLWAWGSIDRGQLGANQSFTIGSPNTSTSTPITTFTGGTNWKQVSAGDAHVAAIKTDGTLWTWGNNDLGQLGRISVSVVSTPVTTFAGGNNWADTPTTNPEDLYTLSAGAESTIAVKTDGTLWVWGNGQLGSLGNGSIGVNALTPITTFSGGTNWRSVSSNKFTTAFNYQIANFGIKTDGTLWVWGVNWGSTGQPFSRLGTYADLDNKSTPVTTFAGGTNWKQISCRYNHVAAIKTDGTLWTWGYANFGRLGNNTSGTTNSAFTPVTTFAGGIDWKHVSSGKFHTAAIKTDGTLWVWGQNDNRQLGNATSTASLTPITTFAGGINWKQVDAGGNVTSAVKTDGTLWIWGREFNGTMGAFPSGGIINVSTPITTIAGGTNWKQVSCADNAVSAVKTDGTLWVWGDTGSSSLGNASIFSPRTPVTTFAGGTTWKQVDIGESHMVALRDDGVNKQLYVWGLLPGLGINATPDNIPKTTFAGGTNWKQIACGRTHTAAVKTDGTLWTWGNGTQSQLGNAGIISVNTPVTTFAGGTDWRQVDGGGRHTAAIKTDGTLWTWGNTQFGQLGIAVVTTFPTRSTPVTTFAGGTNWKQVSCGGYATAAVKTDGTLWTWGYNGSQLGDGTITPSKSTPVTTFTGGTNWKQVSCSPVSSGHMMALQDDGINRRLYVWGINTNISNFAFNGALGFFSNQNSNEFNQTFAGGTNWKQVSSGTSHTAAIKTDGTLWTWGYGAQGQNGNFNTSNMSTPVTTIAGGTDWKQVSAGGLHTAAIKTDGTLWTWGRGNNGALGTNDSFNRFTPVTTFAGGTDWKQVSAGSGNTISVKTDGTLWIWGLNNFGSLGNSPAGQSTGTVLTPITTFAGGTNWKQAHFSQSGYSNTPFAVAIKTDGTLWGWGDNRFGQLGTNDVSNKLTPVTTFAGGTNWKQIHSGQRVTFALKDDGVNKQLWGWGSTYSSMLGFDNLLYRPVEVFGNSRNWKQVSASSSHKMAIKTDGTLWTWGFNYIGQLGTNDKINKFTPVTTFAGGTNWKQSSTRETTSTAIKTDGTLWTWGRGGDGQLGQNDTGLTEILEPKEIIPGTTNWKDTGTSNAEDLYTISTGYSSGAIKTDGTLWVWGSNEYGSLGDAKVGDFTGSATPITTFSGGTTWRQISTGYAVSAAIKTDGTLWTWGYNYYGALGTGDSIDRSTPVTTKVGGTNWKQVSVSTGYYFSKTAVGAVKTDGTLWTWGYNYYYQLAQFPLYDRFTPITTFVGGTNWADTPTTNSEDLYTLTTSSDASSGFSAAIKTDGTLWVWGTGNSLGTTNLLSSFGRLETPTTTFAGGTNWKQIDRQERSCVSAVKTDGTLWTWGFGYDGALGNASIINRTTPITTFAGGTDWKQSRAGFRHQAAIKTDGTLWLWGNGASGRLGNALFVSQFAQISTPITTFAGGTNWKQVSAGTNHTAAVKTDGTLWVWGMNTYGQLGNLGILTGGGSTTPTGGSILTPSTTFAGGTNWADTPTTNPEDLYTISAGKTYTAAIKTDGTLWTWGSGQFGQLGNAVLAVGAVRTPITTFAGGTNWKQLSASIFHTAAIKTDGTLWLWGSSSSGYLGNNAGGANISTPITTFSGGIDWKQVSSGGRHTAAIKTDGTLWTWGFGPEGRHGTNDSTTRFTPVTTFAGGTNWKQVSAGYKSASAVKTDGTLWVWGNTIAIQPYIPPTYATTAVDGVCSATAQLTGTAAFSPIPNSGTRITTSSGTGTVSTIGSSLLGPQLLTSAIGPFAGNTDDGYWELLLPFNISYNGVTYNTIFVGTNSYITFGAGSSEYAGLNFSIPALPKIMISAADNSGQRIYYGTEGTAPNRTYRVRWEGTSSTSGTLGSPNMLWEAVFYENVNNQIDIQVGVNNRFILTSTTFVATPITTFAGGTNWKQVSTAIDYAAAVKTDGTLWIWGANGSGQLGTNDAITRSTPVTTFSGGTNWKQVSVDGFHTAAVKTDGTLWTWGQNDVGQLGVNGTDFRYTPVTTSAGGTDWKQVDVGYKHTVGLRGTIGNMLLYVWGDNADYQLGFASSNCASVPITTFAGGTNWKQVECSIKNTMAVKTDGTLWVWGNNSYRQLGNNSTISAVITPITTFAGGTNWKQVSGSYYSSVAVKTDGTLWTWGPNDYGQLGTNDKTSRPTPVTTFAGGINWVQARTSRNSTIALKNTAGNKELYLWGAGENFALGIGKPVHRYEPSKVNGTNWKTVSMGYNHSAAIKTDGTLWLWGTNEGYALSIPNQGDQRITPIEVTGGGTTWKQIDCGGYFNGTIKTDGTLWTWGECFSDGRVGQAVVNPVQLPNTTFAGGTNWKQVSCAYEFSGAIKTDGTLWTWGQNYSGQLGNGTTDNASTPVTTFTGGTNWVQVAVAEDSRSIGLKSNGTLWTWGTAVFSGIFNQSPITPSTTFAGGTNWKQVSSGGSHTAAIKTDGSLWAWGSNSQGVVGTNDIDQRNTPVTTFVGGIDWKQVSAGSNTSAAIKSIDLI